MRQRINKLVGLLKRKDLIIFVGSGISLFLPSKLPSGVQLRNTVLESLAIKTPVLKTDIETIKKEDPAPERLYQIIHDFIGDNFLYSLDFLKIDRPNSNHILLAKMAKLNLLRTIITTNFDCLIEEALKKGRLKEGTDFFVYYNEDGFRRYLHQQSRDTISVIKLHGSIKDKQSIIATLRQTGKDLSESQSQILDNLLKKHHVLFVGYSGNDLDIYPKILGMSNSAKGIYWNFRSKNEISRGMKKILSSYKKAYPIVMDLRELFEQMAQGISLSYCQPELPSEESQQRFFELLDVWTGEMKVYQPPLILGLLSLYFFLYDVAISCFQVLLGIAYAHKKNDFLLGVAYHSLGTAYVYKKKFNKAIDCFKRNLEVYEKLGNHYDLAATYNKLGEAYREKGEGYKTYAHWKKAKAAWDRAIECHKMALGIYKKIGDLNGLLRTYGDMALLYRAKGRLGKYMGFTNKWLHLIESPEGIKQLNAMKKQERPPLKSYFYVAPNIGYDPGELDGVTKLYKRSMKD